MKNKFFGLLFVALILSVQNIMAQGHHGRFNLDKFSEYHCRNISADLNLDEATASEFLAIYKRYVKEIHTLKLSCADHKNVCTRQENCDEMSDDEIDRAIRNRFLQTRKMLDIREKYYHEFRKCLSPRQIERMYRKERYYGEAMKNELHRRKGQHCNNNSGH